MEFDQTKIKLHNQGNTSAYLRNVDIFVGTVSTKFNFVWVRAVFFDRKSEKWLSTKILMIMRSSWFCHWLTYLFYCIWWDRMNFLNIIVIRLCILELCCQPWIRFRGLHFSRKESINFAISPTCQHYWEILPSIKVLAFAQKHNGLKKFPMEFSYLTFVTKINQFYNLSLDKMFYELSWSYLSHKEQISENINAPSKIFSPHFAFTHSHPSLHLWALGK